MEVYRIMTKYYIMMTGEADKKWGLLDSSSNEVIKTFHNKEKAIQYVNQLCSLENACSIVINDQTTHQYYSEDSDSMTNT